MTSGSHVCEDFDLEALIHVIFLRRAGHFGNLLVSLAPLLTSAVSTRMLQLSHDDILASSQHEMVDIDLRSLEPFPCADEPPDEHQEHGATVHEARPIHHVRAGGYGLAFVAQNIVGDDIRKIRASDAGEAEDRYH